MTNKNVPSWLTANEEYKPKKDNNSFATSSQKATIRLLSTIKRNNDTYKTKQANTCCRLFVVLVTIILTAISSNYSVVLFMIGLTTIRVAMLKAEKIKSLIKVLFPALIISALILIPSIFIGNPKSLLTILGKILVCISLVISFSLSTPWNEITRALKLFHIPDIIIFTFDLTIKYIFVLGEICSQMLTALLVRSIGKNKDKKGSMSGIMGTIFIKAKNAGEDTTRAMECRGFCGKYTIQKGKKLNINDLILWLVFAIIVGVFIYLEVII